MALFEKRAFGLDIADHTIEVVEMKKSFFSPRPVVAARQRMPLENGIVDSGRVVNRKMLAEAITLLWNALGSTPASVVFGLPERQVYTSLITIPASSPSAEMIADMAAKTIPIERDDLSLASVVIARTRESTDLLVYGASREYINEWRDFFESIDIAVLAFDHELLAIERGLFGRAAHDPCCVIDIGAERTKIAIFSNGALMYVAALDIAGDAYTREIAKALDLPLDAAEKMKREQGMQPANLYALFTKLLAPMVAEISAAVSYADDALHTKIPRAVLVGGSSQMKGLPEYLAEQLHLPVELGRPFLFSGEQNAGLLYLHYIEAIGLALRGVEPQWETLHPPLR
ncbi:pilus assembly protein PilM [Candidatus Uhrbacteria bacterium]|nr:pilus assembly protein PilM [Candidatus Uhrbacteria bacterium]